VKGPFGTNQKRGAYVGVVGEKGGGRSKKAYRLCQKFQRQLRANSGERRRNEKSKR